jgi:hypothetical protein
MYSLSGSHTWDNKMADIRDSEFGSWGGHSSTTSATEKKCRDALLSRPSELDDNGQDALIESAIADPRSELLSVKRCPWTPDGKKINRGISISLLREIVRFSADDLSAETFAALAAAHPQIADI